MTQTITEMTRAKLMEVMLNHERQGHLHVGIPELRKDYGDTWQNAMAALCDLRIVKGRMIGAAYCFEVTHDRFM